MNPGFRAAAICRRWLLAPLVGGVLGLIGVSAPAAPIVEVQVSADPIVDFEFDWARDGVWCPSCNFGQGNSRITFTDREQNLWVGGVDYMTGDFIPRNGRGVLVDTNSSFSTDFGNGPEWMFSTGPSQIVYTRYRDGSRDSTFSAGAAIASMRADGNWSAGVMFQGEKKQSPAATLDLDDPQPRLNYQDYAKKKVYWRTASQPGSEKLLPISEQTGGGSRRWVPGTRQIVFSGSAAPDDQGVVYQQVFVYDTDTDALEQLTFDPVTKWGAFMWRAPEFNNEMVFFTVYGRTKLAVYRKLPDANGQLKWTAFNMVDMPASLPYIWSPEVFVHNNRSWVFFQISSSPQANDMSVPTQLGMTGIDPAHPNFRMLTNDSTVRRVRMDPEYFITAKGPYIYYNRYIPSTPERQVKNDGVWRVDTGLGPPASTAPVTRNE